jgi:ABC-type transport system involved in multi-copper enzyme maturation permease subunit
MSSLPMVERELRLQARRTMTYYQRCAIVLVGTLLIFSLLPLGLGMGKDPTVIGRNLYWSLALLMFACALLAGPILTADCLSEEKREGTLGLLFLTELKGYDVVLGKLFATGLPAFYSLLAAIPLLAIPFFFGGITAGEFWRITATLVGTLLFSLVAGLFVSTISRDGRRACLATAGATLTIALGPPLALHLGANSMPAAVLLSLPSPGNLLLLVADNSYAAAGGQFHRMLTGLMLGAMAVLALAGSLLPQTWQERPPRAGLMRDAATPCESLTLRRWLKRRRLLEINPMLWLADRTGLNRIALVAFWTVGLFVWLCVFFELRHQLLALEELFASVYLLHTAMKCWIAWEASRRLVDDRRSGALELVLTTPLSQRALLWGWLRGLIRRLAGPLALLLALDLVLWWRSNEGTWLIGLLLAMGLLVVDSYTLCWVGLAQGIIARTSTRACLRTVLQVLLIPWGIFLLLLAVWGARMESFSPETGWVLVVWFLIGYAWDLVCTLWGTWRLGRDIRERLVDLRGTKHQSNAKPH